MQPTENDKTILSTLAWIEVNQRHEAGDTLLVSAAKLAGLKTLADAFCAQTAELDELDAEIAALKAKLTKRGRPAANNGVAQTGTERSKASRERKARIEAPFRAEITGLKAQIDALEAQIKQTTQRKIG